jgi:hypothetical protein
LTAPVRLKSVRIERSRQFGELYLALALWRGVGSSSCASSCFLRVRSALLGRRWRRLLVTARFCEPSSELHIAEDRYRRRALGDLLQLGAEEVNRDRLYRALDRLLAHKSALEAHLSKRCGELFAVRNDVLLLFRIDQIARQTIPSLAIRAPVSLRPHPESSSKLQMTQ